MILPDLVLNSLIDQRTKFSGIDSYAQCRYKKHFVSYPHDIDYVYNSRGFRDTEWPDTIDELKNCIWCIGDSFTVGIGQPYHHIWPQVLAKHTYTRTINVSMDGASNEWIARQCEQILNEVAPDYLVVMWSFVERREKSIQQLLQDVWQKWYESCADQSWPDCPQYDQIATLPSAILKELRDHHQIPLEPESCRLMIDHVPWCDDTLRRLRPLDTDSLENFALWKECVRRVVSAGIHTNVLHFCVPNFVEGSMRHRYHAEFLSVPNMIGEVPILDLARDSFHFDIKTAQWMVDRVMPHF